MGHKIPHLWESFCFIGESIANNNSFHFVGPFLHSPLPFYGTYQANQ